MGTTWYATVVGGEVSGKAIAISLQVRLDELEGVFSNWRADSSVSRWNASRSTDWQAVPHELAEVVSFARCVSQETHGAFDVTASPLIDLWGFGAKGRITTPPNAEAITQAKVRCGWEKLEVKLDPPMLRKLQPDVEINVSALVEGYAVDDLVRRLRAQGIQDFLLDMGGELFASGRKADGSPWQVGVQRPDAEKGIVVGTMPLRDKALATSGTYRQFFERDGRRYAHVLDARTGRPVEHGIVSVSVIADSCFAADAWATALLAVGTEEGRGLSEKRGIKAMFMAEQAMRSATQTHGGAKHQ